MSAADTRYQKTEAGRAEIKTRSLVNSRVARNLLLVVDTSKPAAEWLSLVQGARIDDLDLLLTHGLIAPVAVPGGAVAAPAPAAVAAPAAPAVPAAPPQRALDGSAMPSLERAALYTYLTAQGKPRLGLIKGFRFVLDVERCDSLGALQSLGLQFVDLVREAQGPEAAAQVRRDLGMGN